MVNTTLRTLALSLSLTLASVTAHSETLTEEATVKLAPSENAAVLRILPAGSELKPATDTQANDTAARSTPAVPRQINTSATWQAVTLNGPFTLYVRNGDIDKGLAIKPAAPLYLEPDNAAAVVTYAEEGDAITITGLRGRWTQIELDKPLTGYVATKTSNAPATTNDEAATTATTVALETAKTTEIPPVTNSTADATAQLPESETLAPEAEPKPPAVIDSEPAAQTASDARAQEPTVALSNSEGSASSERSTREWRAAASTTVSQLDEPTTEARQIKQPATAALNRSQIQGKLVSTRKRFGARRPYEWQINAKFSFRIAYLDFSRMQGTDQLARYEGRQVIVYGLVSPLGDGQYVMQVESIRLQ